MYILAKRFKQNITTDSIFEQNITHQITLNTNRDKYEKQNNNTVLASSLFFFSSFWTVIL